ncbi:MAG: protein translocase subunit SecF [Shewanellaceae bacterium]|nr:protein translocase subunit SecF [Shewanellaceae bacterium]
MFEILSLKQRINFLKHSVQIGFVSMALLLGSVVSLAVQGLSWGLDFTGGTVVEMTFSKPVDLSALRQHMLSNQAQDLVVQRFGTAKDIIFRLPSSASVKVDTIKALAQSFDAQVVLKRVEMIGPAVGQELAEQGGFAVMTALFCILLYVSMRFEWRLALGAVAALAHDVLMTLGVFSVLQIEFDLTVLAGVLTVVGYSLNDTIVVFDRIRENFIKLRNNSVAEMVNTSITQTMSRTIITTLTTLMVVIALFMKGGANIHGFATALLLGIVVGTYSSIYVASALAIRLGISRESMLPEEVEKEGADQPSLTY